MAGRRQNLWLAALLASLVGSGQALGMSPCPPGTQGCIQSDGIWMILLELLAIGVAILIFVLRNRRKKSKALLLALLFGLFAQIPLLWFYFDRLLSCCPL